MLERRQWIVLLVLFVVVPALLVWAWWPAPRAAKVFPSPNGYDDFVAAVTLLIVAPPDPWTAAPADWEYYLTNNLPALNRLREGLTKSCLVSNRYDPAGFAIGMERLGHMKQLGYLFRAEAEVAYEAGQSDKAVTASLDGVRFGVESARGGVLIEGLVGLALQRLALQPLETRIASFERAAAGMALTGLLQIDRAEPPPAETIAAEKAALPQLEDRLTYFAYLVGFGRKQFRVNEDKFVQKHHANTTHRRQLIIRLAARLHELDTGKAPSAWSDLVPKYLPEIPKDAETGKELPLP